MSSTNKTSLGLNMWEASDKPVRQDFVKDNVIIDDEVTKLKQDIGSNNTVINEKINKLNSNLNDKNNVVTPKAGVRYVKFGRMVIVSLSLAINGDAALGIPAGVQDNIAIKCRNDNDGSFATFYISGGSLTTYLAENYKAGNTYTGAFSYISGS